MKLLIGFLAVPWLGIGALLAVFAPVSLPRRLFGAVAWPYIPAWVAWREHQRRKRNTRT